MIKLLSAICVMVFFTACAEKSIESCSEVAISDKNKKPYGSEGVCEQVGYVLDLGNTYFLSDVVAYGGGSYLLGLPTFDSEYKQFLKSNVNQKIYILGDYAKGAQDNAILEDVHEYRVAP